MTMMAPFRPRMLSASPTTSTVSAAPPKAMANPTLRPWYMTFGDRNRLRQQIRDGEVKLCVRMARPEDQDVILEMVEEAKQWLPTIGTSQWSTDWKDGDNLGRSERVERSIKEGTTWLIYAPYRKEEMAVATVTIEYNVNSMVWSGVNTGSRRCAYLGRLVTARDFAGLDIGTGVIDWACRYAAEAFGARRMRIDVWTDNYRLHDYYLARGFRPWGLCADESYPSRARFERRTGRRTRRGAPELVRV